MGAWPTVLVLERSFVLDLEPPRESVTVSPQGLGETSGGSSAQALGSRLGSSPWSLGVAGTQKSRALASPPRLRLRSPHRAAASQCLSVVSLLPAHRVSLPTGPTLAGGSGLRPVCAGEGWEGRDVFKEAGGGAFHSGSVGPGSGPGTAPSRPFHPCSRAGRALHLDTLVQTGACYFLPRRSELQPL